VAQDAVLSAELKKIVNVWPSLPEAVRAGIVAMVQAFAK
jgi:hypothetical protein